MPGNKGPLDARRGLLVPGPVALINLKPAPSRLLTPWSFLFPSLLAPAHPSSHSLVPSLSKNRDQLLFFPCILYSVQLTLSLAFITSACSYIYCLVIPTIDTDRSLLPSPRSDRFSACSSRRIILFHDNHEDVYHPLGPRGPHCRLGHPYEDREAAPQQARVGPHRHCFWQR